VFKEVLVAAVNYNTPDITRDFVTRLRQNAPTFFDVVIVSCDGADYYEGAVTIHVNNKGYAGNMNMAVRYAFDHRYAFILMANNDIDLSPETVSVLYRCLLKHPEAAAAAPTQVTNKGVVPSGFRLQSSWWAPYKLIPVIPEPGSCANCDVLLGPALMVKTAALMDVGLLDERYFHYFEDGDLTLRLCRAGWHLIALGDRLFHKHGATLDSSTVLAAYYYYRNYVLFVRKHFPSFNPFPPSALRNVLALRSRARGHSQLPNAKLLGLLHGLVRRTGPLK
jgi:N-acetylglucosaminyl-diphospho-decaprenol L-rhamnosyltransferase